MLAGASIAGGTGRYERQELDYYATPPEAVKKLLDAHLFTGKKILEPCVGGGHIADVVKCRYPQGDMTYIDIENRGYPGTIQTDFLAWGGRKVRYNHHESTISAGKRIYRTLHRTIAERRTACVLSENPVFGGHEA